jgi:hypothetical protein
MEMVILDASDSAQAFDREIIDMACSVLRERVNADATPVVFFLGNCQRYITDAGGLDRDGVRWFQQNKGRCSLLLPLLESNKIGPDDKIVIIGNGPVFDLKDLAGSLIKPKNILLVYIQERLHDSDGLFEQKRHDHITPQVIGRFLGNVQLASDSTTAGSIDGSVADSTPWLPEDEWGLSSDKTGFPVVELYSLGYRMHLLPVAKVQFERFLIDRNDFGDKWYEEVFMSKEDRRTHKTYPLENPRISYTRFSAEQRERLLATGLLVREVSEFAKWLGEGKDEGDGEDWNVPTVDVWRDCYAKLEAIQLKDVIGAMLRELRSDKYHKSASTFIRSLHKQLNPQNMLEFSLMSGGVFEWVRYGQLYAEHAVLGCPRYSFTVHLLDPVRCSPLLPINPDKERRYDIGFRLFQRI